MLLGTMKHYRANRALVSQLGNHLKAENKERSRISRLVKKPTEKSGVVGKGSGSIRCKIKEETRAREKI